MSSTDEKKNIERDSGGFPLIITSSQQGLWAALLNTEQLIHLKPPYTTANITLFTHRPFVVGENYPGLMSEHCSLI